MSTIIGLSGSLRRASINSRLLSTAADLAPAGVQIEVVTLHGIPLYDGDLEAREGVPEVVRALQERIARASGLLLATPEYNHSVPGVAKNGIDWLTRPPKQIPRVFGGLPVAIIGASPGRGGTALAQNAWLPILHVLGTRPWFGQTLQIARAGELFDDSGLRDEDMRKRLTRFLNGFAEFIAANRRVTAPA